MSHLPAPRADERPTQYLVTHQTRTREPSAYEYKLAQVLEEVFGQVGHELSDVVRGLNDRSVRAPDGAPWTEESFRTEMKRLGA